MRPALPLRSPSLPALAPLLLLAAALAGCTVEPPVVEGQPPGGLPGGAPPAGPDGTPAPDGGAGPPFPSPTAGPANVTADSFELQAPRWVRGDAWRWNAAFTGGSESQQWVMVGETAQDYLLASTGIEEAITQAFRGSSLPGPVNKAFLSGYELGARTNYLAFPLAQNKTWNLHIRDSDYLVEARFVPRVENGRGAGFEVTGASIDGNRIRLTYDPEVKWMTLFQITGPDGQPVFSRTLAGFTQNHTGPYFTARAEDLYTTLVNGTRPVAPVDTFEQSGAFTRLRMAVGVVGTGLVELHVVDNAGQAQYNLTLQGVDVQQFDIVDLPNVPGTWRVGMLVTGSIEVSLRVAGIEVTTATL